ncbi:hypothetical protein BGZ82_002822 [Podila clonocystis]|nr:hypothetical protein BGZ82_002822 [Podila clonocystis]
MDHGGGHGGGGHDGGDHGGDHGEAPTCSMNMLFNWQTENLCVVFESWRIDTPIGLVFSFLVIVAMAASYEALRGQSRRFEERLIEGERKRHPESSGGIGEDETPLLASRSSSFRLSNQQRLTRALFYMAQVFVGFFLMLIFMTYNGYLMAATVLGAGIGFFYFGGDTLATSTKALSCH